MKISPLRKNVVVRGGRVTIVRALGDFSLTYALTHRFATSLYIRNHCHMLNVRFQLLTACSCDASREIISLRFALQRPNLRNNTWKLESLTVTNCQSRCERALRQGSIARTADWVLLNPRRHDTISTRHPKRSLESGRVPFEFIQQLSSFHLFLRLHKSVHLTIA